MHSIQNHVGARPIGEIVADCMDAAERARRRHEHTPGQPGALGGGMTMEALPTWYRGTTFRSALEAGWAATLDSLDITWQYEPKTFTLPSGATYLPDLWLPDHGIWLEVKGTGVPRVEKAFELGAALACDCGAHCTCRWPGGELVLIGHPPVPYEVSRDSRYGDRPYWERRYRKHSCPVWSSTNGRSALLSRCTHCKRAGWAIGPRCRACEGVLLGEAFTSGSAEIEFMAVSVPPRPRPDGEAAA